MQQFDVVFVPIYIFSVVAYKWIKNKQKKLQNTSMIWAASIMILALSIPDILLQWPKADLAASTASSTSTAPQGSKWHKTRPEKWNIWWWEQLNTG